MEWIRDEDDKKMTANDVFEEGKTYIIGVWLEARDKNTIFTGDTTITVNGSYGWINGGFGDPLTIILARSRFTCTAGGGEELYDLWLGATRVTSANRDDILNDGGKAQFDPDTCTLTLNDPEIGDVC